MARNDADIDKDILQALPSFQGVPTTSALSYANGGPLQFTAKVIIRRMKQNPAIESAIEKRALEYIRTCPEEKLRLLFPGIRRRCLKSRGLSWTGVSMR